MFYDHHSAFRNERPEKEYTKRQLFFCFSRVKLDQTRPLSSRRRLFGPKILTTLLLIPTILVSFRCLKIPNSCPRLRVGMKTKERANTKTKTREVEKLSCRVNERAAERSARLVWRASKRASERAGLHL